MEFRRAIARSWSGLRLVTVGTFRRGLRVGPFVNVMVASLALAILLMLVLSLLNVGWDHPINDASYKPYDPALVYMRDGRMAAPPEMGWLVSASSTGATTVTLFATPLKRVVADVDVKVTRADSALPALKLGVWSPWTGQGFFVVFESDSRRVLTETVTDGSPSPMLAGGVSTPRKIFGEYELGRTYHIQIVINRPSAISLSASGESLSGADTITVHDLPSLFGVNQIAATASAGPSGGGPTEASLTNFSLALPHQIASTNTIQDARYHAICLVLIFLAAVLLVTATASRVPSWAASSFSWLRSVASKKFGLHNWMAAIIGTTALVAGAAGNLALFQLGSHPFDMGDEKLFAYVATVHGPTQLYYLPGLVSLANIWGGIPFMEAAFPYEPILAYLFTADGWLHAHVLAPSVPLMPDSLTLEYVIKGVNVLFGLGDSILIYLILMQLNVAPRWRYIGAGLFLFNPAVWFSMSVWGQTHVFSLFFVLAAILSAEKHLPVWAWLSLALACLTRPQMIVFGLLLAIVFARVFSRKENLLALAWTVVVVFLVLSPFVLATSASLPVDIMLNVVRVQEVGGNIPALTTVSQDALSIWPLITYLAQGASGLGRTFTSSSQALVGPVTYLQMGQILTVGALLAVSAALIVKKPATLANGGYLPLVTLGITSFLMFLTGLVATHFLLGLPLILLCRKWMSGPAYLYITLIWTVTTLVPMYADMATVVSTGGHSQLLAISHNAISRFVVQLYRSDRFITTAVIGNMCALLWIAYWSLRPMHAAPAPPVAAPRPA